MKQTALPAGIPLPPESQLYSPTQDSDGSELGSPPRPPPAAPQPKVLGSDQAKRRLQAFARARLASPKGKVPSAFSEEEPAGPAAGEKKRPPAVKDSTPVMASIMKEETESRELVKKSMESLAKRNEEAESERKKDLDHRKIPFEEQEDLRDILMKRREEKERAQGEGGRRSGSRRGRRSRSGSGRRVPGSRRSRSGSSSSRSAMGRKSREGRGAGRRDPRLEPSEERDARRGRRGRRAGSGDSKRRAAGSPRGSGEGSPQGSQRTSSPAGAPLPAGEELVLVRPAAPEDYLAVKGSPRAGARQVPLVARDGGQWVAVPAKYIKLTSSGLRWSLNREACEAADPVAMRSLEIRKSVESAVMDLEMEMIKKRSRDNSPAEEEEDVKTSSKKKKKRRVKSPKKEKPCKKKLDKSTSSSSSSSSKKKNKKRAEDPKPVPAEAPPAGQSPELRSSRQRTVSGASGSSGLSKLFSMAGYPKPEEVEAGPSPGREASLSPSPLKPRPAARSPPSRARSPEAPPEERPFSPVELSGGLYAGEPQGSPVRSPSPSLMADLSRISTGPRTPSPGPRLPKFKDSRSPSKVPIMRDRRSPIREEAAGSGKKSSPRKRSSKKNKRPQHDSPRGAGRPESPRPESQSPGLAFPCFPRGLEGLPEDPGFEQQLSRHYSRESGGPHSPSPPPRQTSPGLPYSPLRSPSRSPSPAAKTRPASPPGSPYRAGPPAPYSPGRRLDPQSPLRHFSPPSRRGPYSPKPRSPPRRPRSPERRGPYSPEPAPRSPLGDRRGPYSPRRGPRSPDRRPPSPRGRRPRSPEGRRPPSPQERRGPYSPRARSPFRGERSPLGDRRGPYSPRRGPRSPDRRPPSPRGRYRSPDRRRYSPERRPYSPDRRRHSQEREPRSLPDSTISDAELARQMPPPSGHGKQFSRQFPGLGAVPYADSPKRLSLDERLEREHGIKLEQEQQQQPAMVDFSRPPPGFPGGPPLPFVPRGQQGPGGNHGALGPGQAPMAGGHGQGAHGGGGQPGVAGPHGAGAFPRHSSGGVLAAVRPHQPAPPPVSSGSLPTTIPTYDSEPSATRSPSWPTPPKAVIVEKEAAMVAAQAVASKLQEMQAAKEEERRVRKEQKMAERLAAQLTEVAAEALQAEGPVRAAATGRILDMVERRETLQADSPGPGGEARQGAAQEAKAARRKRKEKDSPLLITLKPFYRPNEKNGKKKKGWREAQEAEEAAQEETFVPRSPVPLPDCSGLKPVLVKPYLARMKLPAERKTKGVRYADGVLPGQGSPDHGQGPPPPPLPPPPRKRYKKVTITIIETHEGDTDSEEESPPPPPPGSPPRYRLADLQEMFGRRPVEAAA